MGRGQRTLARSHTLALPLVGDVCVVSLSRVASPLCMGEEDCTAPSIHVCEPTHSPPNLGA